MPPQDQHHREGSGAASLAEQLRAGPDAAEKLVSLVAELESCTESGAALQDELAALASEQIATSDNSIARIGLGLSLLVHQGTSAQRRRAGRGGSVHFRGGSAAFGEPGEAEGGSVWSPAGWLMGAAGWSVSSLAVAEGSVAVSMDLSRAFDVPPVAGGSRQGSSQSPLEWLVQQAAYAVESLSEAVASMPETAEWMQIDAAVAAEAPLPT